MGALDGVRVLELAGIGPAPYGVMLLADMGAEVVRVDRVGDDPMASLMSGLSRGRRSIAVDLKTDEGRGIVQALAADADVFVEGFRPGVAERLGVGPDVLCDRNPRLIYARMTGWGQDGPLADRAGHDIDYAAVAGALHPIGPSDRPPVPPVNFIADFGGGGTFLALGVVTALFERERSGKGQVVDAAMIDGTASLTAFLRGLRAAGVWSTTRGTNFLDGGAPYYRCYRCADDRFVAVGAIEPAFYAALCAGLGVGVESMPQHDVDAWPAQHAEFERIFATRTRDEWMELFDASDACVAPVLDLDEAPEHPHNREREVFVEVDGSLQPAPAPRLGRTPGRPGPSAPDRGAHTDEILAEVGYDRSHRLRLRADGIIA